MADVFGEGIRETIPAMEEKIGMPFEVVLMYLQLGLPLEPRRTFEAVGSPSHFGEE